MLRWWSCSSRERKKRNRSSGSAQIRGVCVVFRLSLCLHARPFCKTSFIFRENQQHNSHQARGESKIWSKGPGPFGSNFDQRSTQSENRGKLTLWGSPDALRSVSLHKIKWNRTLAQCGKLPVKRTSQACRCGRGRWSLNLEWSRLLLDIVSGLSWTLTSGERSWPSVVSGQALYSIFWHDYDSSRWLVQHILAGMWSPAWCISSLMRVPVLWIWILPFLWTESPLSCDQKSPFRLHRTLCQWTERPASEAHLPNYTLFPSEVLEAGGTFWFVDCLTIPKSWLSACESWTYFWFGHQFWPTIFSFFCKETDLRAQRRWGILLWSETQVCTCQIRVYLGLGQFSNWYIQKSGGKGCRVSVSTLKCSKWATGPAFDWK